MNVTFEKVEDERVQKYYDQSFEGMGENPFIRNSPGGQLLRERYSLFREKIQNFEIFEDDIWIATFPRSGTRWLQEMVWCLRHGMNNENGKNLEYRVPYFEIDIITDISVDFPLMDDTAKMERPRTIKTHLRYDMIPEQLKAKNTKMIYLMRNPRDVICSHLNYLRLINNYSGDQASLVDLLTNDLLEFSPYSTHVMQYWNKSKELSNLLIVSYEEMQIDLAKAVRKVAAFLNVTISEEEVAKLCDHLDVNRMRKNASVNMDIFFKDWSKETKLSEDYTGKMINRGMTGNWKNQLDDKMIEQMKDWEEKWLKDSDLKFVFEV